MSNANLIGRWDFTASDPSTARKNLAPGGHFQDLVLQGNAPGDTRTSLHENSGLTLSGQGAWAEARGVAGKLVREKTLIAWVLCDDPGAALAGGSALGLEDAGRGQFDGLVFSEKNPRTWMAGSDTFKRSNIAANPPAVQTDYVNKHKLAATYSDVGGNVVVRLYIDDVLVDTIGGAAGIKPMPSYDLASSRALFGARHTRDGQPVGGLMAKLLAAEIHDRALAPAELAAVQDPSAKLGTNFIGVPIPRDFSGDVELQTVAVWALWEQRTTVVCPQLLDAGGQPWKAVWQTVGPTDQRSVAPDRRQPFGGAVLRFTGPGTYTLKYTIEHRVTPNSPWQPNTVRAIQTAARQPNGDLVWQLDSEDGGDSNFKDTVIQVTATRAPSSRPITVTIRT